MISAPLLMDLLPRDLRGELCIAGIAVRARGSAIVFRMDPGRAFERHGIVTGTGGLYRVAVADRHRPGDPFDVVAGAWGMTAAEVPDELRGAASRAWCRAAARPHWRATFGDDTYPLTGEPDSAVLAALRDGAPPGRLQPVGPVPAQVKGEMQSKPRKGIGR